jgi:ABC-2 type transport system permease protein
MKAFIIYRLIMKDWYLQRVAIALLLGGMIIAGVLAALPGEVGFSVGLSLTMGVLIALTFYLPLTTVIGERTSKTLPFTMSLPISPIEYTVSKIIANLLLYLVPWIVAAVSFALILGVGSTQAAPIAAGYVDVLLVGFLVVFMFVLAFAIIFESMGWTVSLIVILMFLIGNVGTQVVPRITAARDFLVAVGQRGPEYLWTLGGEFFVIVLIMAVTFFVQSRKRDFL